MVVVKDVPNAMSPRRIMAVPFIKTRNLFVRGKTGQIARGRTPIPNPLGLLLTGIEHGRDEHEARGDGPFAYTEEHTTGEQAPEILRCCMT